MDSVFEGQVLIRVTGDVQYIRISKLCRVSVRRTVADRDHIPASNLGSGNFHIFHSKPAVPLNWGVVA